MSLDPIADAIRREFAERGPVFDPDEKLAIVARAQAIVAAAQDVRGTTNNAAPTN